MSGDTFNRRELVAGALATATSVLMPPSASATAPLSPDAALGPEFLAKRARLHEALEHFRAARRAKVAARARIGADMRKSGNPVTTFFNAPEIKASARTRLRARGAAEDIFFSPASNDAEIELQEEVRKLFDAELGGDNGMSRPLERRERLQARLDSQNSKRRT